MPSRLAVSSITLISPARKNQSLARSTHANPMGGGQPKPHQAGPRQEDVFSPLLRRLCFMVARFVCVFAFCACLSAQQSQQPSITIYNQDFAVVRQDMPLDLKAG